MRIAKCLALPLVILMGSASLAATDSATWGNRMQEANRLDGEGRYNEAQTLYLAALEEAEKSEPADPRLAESLNNLAAHYFHRGKYAEAETLYRRALEAWKTSRGDVRQNLALTMNNLAALFRAQGRYGEAEPLYSGALRTLEQTSGPDSPAVSVTLNNLAELYRTRGA